MDQVSNSTNSGGRRWWIMPLMITLLVSALFFAIIYHYYNETLTISVDKIQSLESLEASLDTGDIFCCRDLSSSTFRIAVTNSSWSHIGFVYKKDNELYVVEVYGWVFTVHKLRDVVKEYQSKFGFVGVRKLNKKLNDEQRQKLEELVPKILHCNKGKEMDKWTHKWSYYLQPTCINCPSVWWLSRPQPIDKLENVWLCTDLTAFILKELDILPAKNANFCTRPSFFCTQEINKALKNTEYQYNDTIFILPLDKETALQSKLLNLLPDEIDNKENNNNSEKPQKQQKEAEEKSSLDS